MLLVRLVVQLVALLVLMVVVAVVVVVVVVQATLVLFLVLVSAGPRRAAGAVHGASPATAQGHVMTAIQCRRLGGRHVQPGWEAAATEGRGVGGRGRVVVAVVATRLVTPGRVPLREIEAGAAPRGLRSSVLAS